MLSFAAFLAKHHIRDEVIAVAVSGGADSLALVLAAAAELKVYGQRVVALTVDHGLRPASAAEAAYVAALMQQHGIEHHILVWHKNPAQKISEETARHARYALLHEWCAAHHVGCLLTAHHLRDQAETFLLRLQRGSGLEGLCAMREVSTYNNLKILRPLLQVAPEELRAWLMAQNIRWCEDESNADQRYQRNKIRAFLPQLAAHTGITPAKLAAAAHNLQSAESFIAEQVEKTQAQQVTSEPGGVLHFAYTDYLSWHPELKFRLLARFCQRDYIPRAERVLRLIARLNKLPFSGATLGEKVIVWADNRVWIIPQMPAKHQPSRQLWQEFVAQNPAYKNRKVPHKARLAILQSWRNNAI